MWSLCHVVSLCLKNVSQCVCVCVCARLGVQWRTQDFSNGGVLKFDAGRDAAPALPCKKSLGGGGGGGGG